MSSSGGSMRGPFGLLLIGGGIILIFGLFTGKIVFPGPASGTGIDAPNSGTNGQAYVDKNGNVQPQQGTGFGGSTTALQHPATVKGQPTCPAGYQMMPTGICMRQGAIKNIS